MSLARAMAATTTYFTPATYDSTFGYTPTSGITSVTPDSAMTISAVYACVAVISEDIASVPLQIFRRGADGSKDVAGNHPLYDLLHDQPNDYQTALEFREMMTAFAMLRPRAVAELVPGPRGAVDQIKPLHPDLVRADRTEAGQLRYLYQDPILRKERTLLPDEVLVLRGRFGRSVLDYARDTFVLAMTMRDHATRSFGRGTRAQGALQHPKTLSDTARANLRKALDSYAAGGENEGRPMLLEEGMEWHQISLTMRDAEFLETFQWSVPEVARFFRVPLHKIQEMTRATFSNIEKQSIEYVTDTIRPWAVRWEQVINRDLIFAVDRYFAEHNLEGLLRGDIATRYRAYAVGRQWGWLSTNDIRRRENLNPIAGGDDDYLTPLNMTTRDGATLAFAPPKQLAEVAGRLRVMVRDAAGRAVRKETAALAKLVERDEPAAAISAFYAEHAEFVAKLLRIDDEDAERYCAERRDMALADPRRVEDEADAIARLTDLALARAEVLALPAEAAAA